ncbi:hypothetical protein [Desulfosporosinus sp.]|nr:hypothetical protein [Desulfosporosinus sp.]MCO5385262.1 hypothetical protein [Desulfosporosinus sp.]
MLSSSLASQAIYGKAYGLNPGLWLEALPELTSGINGYPQYKKDWG